MLRKKMVNKKFFTIRGYQKSGTNWVANILNLHPKILARGEYHFNRIKDCGIGSFLSLPFNKQFENIVNSNFEKTVKECVFNTDGIRSKKEVIMFGDRTPGPGANLMPIISEQYPQIFIIRDGRSVVVSLAYHHMRVLHEIGSKNVFPWPELGMVYKRFPSVVEKSKKLKKDKNYFENHPNELLDNEDYMRFISKAWSDYNNENLINIKKAESGLLNTKVFCIKYEDLHENIEKKRRSMYEFLSVSPEEAKPLTEREKPGFKKTDNLSHYRKGAVSDWVKYFDNDTCQKFKEIAGGVLIKLGYERDNNWNSK